MKSWLRERSPQATPFLNTYCSFAERNTGAATLERERRRNAGRGAKSYERAKRFYARYGFKEVGRCTFQPGDRVDDDRIWCRGVNGSAQALPAKAVQRHF